MPTRIVCLCTVTLTIFSTVTSLFATPKYAGEFLALSGSARSLGMGGAFVALSDDVTAGYWNASGLAQLSRREIMLMHSERFGGIVNFDLGGYAMPLQGNSGVGIMLIRSGVDNIKYTRLDQYDRTEVLEMVSNVDYAVYLSYGRWVSDAFSIGSSVKIIRRKIGDNTADGYGIDIGLLYAPGSGLGFGLNLKDITSTTITWDTGTKDRILPSLDMGLAYSQMISSLNSEAVVSVGLNNESKEWDIDDIKKFNAGMECRYRDKLALRIGSQEGRLTAGAGLRLYAFGIDYAFLGHEELGSTHRASLSLAF